MNITIRPLGRGRFAASVCQCTLCESKTPFLTAARVLQCEGIPDDTPITMKHEGADVVSMKATVGEAASLIVEETDGKGPRFKRYRPMTSGMPRQRVRERPQAAINEAKVGRPRNESEQLSLWDFTALETSPNRRVRPKQERAEEVQEDRVADARSEQLSFFVPHLLGDGSPH